jgi:hypothetical protein
MTCPHRIDNGRDNGARAVLILSDIVLADAESAVFPVAGTPLRWQGPAVVPQYPVKCTNVRIVALPRARNLSCYSYLLPLRRTWIDASS